MSRHEKEILKELKNIERNHCFGCGRDNPAGLQMRFYTDEVSVMSWLHVRPELCGWSNLMHGGIISTILDEIMSWSAIYLLKKFILTKSITVDFLKPVFVIDNLKAVGKVGKLLGEHKAEMTGHLYNDKEELCAKAHATFALMDIHKLRKLHLLDDGMLKAFEKLMDKGF